MATVAAPRVFISYSHDSPAHKIWVLDLAGYLRTNGIDVIIDAWDARLGKDLPKFMEDSVSSAHRVLMICTERYVVKADTAVGGVGYEKMIVTAALIKDLDTTRFVPVLRQTTQPRQLPRFMDGRLYIDLSEAADTLAARQRLLRELHDVPPDRPPLGTSPFSPLPAASAPGALPSSPGSSTPTAALDPVSIYERAITLARSDDMLGWRKLLHSAREGIAPGLAAWWDVYGNALPDDKLIEESMEGVVLFVPLIAASLGAVGSNAPRFKNQAAVLEEILHPPDWHHANYVARSELPCSAAFVYQALHGSMCLHVEDLATALRLACTRTQSAMVREEVPLYRRHDVVMWPQALGYDAIKSWQVISTLNTLWPWIGEIFGNLKGYQIALLAYYVSLNTLEFFERLAVGRYLPDDPATVRTDIPPVFENIGDEIKRGAYHALIAVGESFRRLADQLKVEVDVIRREWPKWMKVQQLDLHNLYPLTFDGVMQKRLILDIFGK